MEVFIGFGGLFQKLKAKNLIAVQSLAKKHSRTNGYLLFFGLRQRQTLNIEQLLYVVQSSVKDTNCRQHFLSSFLFNMLVDAFHEKAMFFFITTQSINSKTIVKFMKTRRLVNHCRFCTLHIKRHFDHPLGTFNIYLIHGLELVTAPCLRRSVLALLGISRLLVLVAVRY